MIHLAVNLDRPDGRYYFTINVDWTKPVLEWFDLTPRIEQAAQQALAAWTGEQTTAADAHRNVRELEERVADACAAVASGRITVTLKGVTPPFQLILGKTYNPNLIHILDEEQRDRHLYIVGATGMGKTTLLKNLALQDVQYGRGVLFVDPDGDAAQDLLDHIPPDRAADTIYFEPTSIPIGLARFDAGSPTERQQLADDLHALFRRLSDTWGERMDAIFRFSIATLLRVPGSTLLDLYYLLDFEDFREKIVAQIDDPVIKRYWRDTYSNYPSNAAEPILSRLSKFVMHEHLKPIAGSRRALNFGEILDRRQILIVNLSRVGGEVDSIIGSILISQLQLAVRRRAEQRPNERIPFSFYIDEFQVFYNPAFERLITQARKHRCFLCIAHHFPHQLDERIRRTIVDLFGTIVCFGLGAESARVMSPIMRQSPELIERLGKYAAYVRRAKTVDVFGTLPFKPDHSGSAEGIIQRTKERYPASYAEREISPADYDYDVGSEEGT